jgi:DNA-binding response OmpR family regulator
LEGKVTLHSGDSKVTFTITLPFVLNVEKVDNNLVSYEYTISEIDNILSENILSESEKMNLHDKRSRKTYSIVIIEDDTNLRNYMEQRLSEHYNVYTASNGNEGIAKTEKIYPQIVITDLMMPEADGFDVCRNLRSNIKTSHIPIIVLSALGKNTENKIKALENGANVFVDKPFDMDYLLKQVDNLIRNQNELKELYSKRYIAEPSKITISSMDEELLKKAVEHIEQNIANCDYNVDSFVSDMAIGRTLLYQKINDITGMSIKEFIIDIRLKRSAQLLKESDLTISEIAYLTGFVNPKYFSICFKKHFELTPSEFKKKSS